MFSLAQPLMFAARADARDVQLLVRGLVSEELERRDAAEAPSRNNAREERAEEEVTPRYAAGHESSRKARGAIVNTPAHASTCLVQQKRPGGTMFLPALTTIAVSVDAVAIRVRPRDPR